MLKDNKFVRFIIFTKLKTSLSETSFILSFTNIFRNDVRNIGRKFNVRKKIIFKNINFLSMILLVKPEKMMICF